MIPISKIQQAIADQGLDGWLLYDFRRTNDLAADFLQIPKETLLTRRFFYWIPVTGGPIKIVHKIETHALDHLPGNEVAYASWKELEKCLHEVLKGKKNVAMEYSPRNALPYISKVDAGTVEFIRDCGVTVETSADLLQQFMSVWDEAKLKSHLYAAQVLDESVAAAWEFIRSSAHITEYDVQQFILEKFKEKGCVTECPPICAVNDNSANPHYMPTKDCSRVIQKGDFILIDLWCKEDREKAVYADITRVGVFAEHPTEKQQHIFEIVKQARDAAFALIQKRFAENVPLMGCEVDDACRQVITNAGYGQYFIHRTGHNIDENDHGNGAHIDNYETQDRRRLLPGTCFSIEPGIYLPGEFGVRLESDVYIHHDGKVQITGGAQDTLVLLC